ncbi:MAG: DUF6261 family protein [Tannerellaceae bacterium]|jgi:hypothetical protein|nr:DUF6261 family protein [Tannerellaceae bacterium]
MKKFITITYKTLLRKLLIGEHFNFFETGVIVPLTALMAGLPMLTAMFNALKAVFAKEDNLFKLSQQAFQTKEIKLQHEMRVNYFIFLWDAVDILRYEANPGIAQAVAKIDYLHHTYENLPSETYYDMTGTMTNFLQDCALAEYQDAFTTLSGAGLVEFAPIITRINAAQLAFKNLYQSRAVDKEHVAQLGLLSEVRFDVDEVFDSFVEAVNTAWASNEYGTKDADLRSKLLEVKELLVAAIHQAQLALSRRGRHRKTKEDGKTDDSTQTPDISNPPAPDTPPQTPDTTPPTIDPDELNPPAVGERKV